MDGFEAAVFRVVELPNSASLADLAYALMIGFATDANHLYRFTIDKSYYDCLPFAMVNDVGDVNLAEHTLLRDLKMSVGAVWAWEYDFGESWCLTCELVSINEHEKNVRWRIPRLVGGLGAGFIENNRLLYECYLERNADECGYDQHTVDSLFDEEFDLVYDAKQVKEFFSTIKEMYETVPDSYSSEPATKRLDIDRLAFVEEYEKNPNLLSFISSSFSDHPEYVSESEDFDRHTELFNEVLWKWVDLVDKYFDSQTVRDPFMIIVNADRLNVDHPMAARNFRKLLEQIKFCGVDRGIHSLMKLLGHEYNRVSEIIDDLASNVLLKVDSLVELFALDHVYCDLLFWFKGDKDVLMNWRSDLLTRHAYLEGFSDTTRAFYKEMISIVPNQPISLHNLMFNGLLMREDYEGATACYEEAIKFYPNGDLERSNLEILKENYQIMKVPAKMN